MEECVKVAVRVRPLTENETREAGQRVCITDLRDGRSLHVDEPGAGKGGKVFGFDRVYGPGDESDKVYEESVSDLIESFMRGINATVMAYGQTGSGKTHTMTGITPKVLAAIFSNPASQSHAVDVSYLEVYNDTVRDLLNTDTEDLPIREAQDGGIHVPNMTITAVTGQAHALSILERGTSYRATAPTLMNSQSSRSHSIFTIHYRRTEADMVFSSKFHLVDLAGSERNKKTGNTGERFKESVGINAGLLALSNVITGLSRKQSQHIPFRDSKLTRLLQDALGGSSRTVFIACVSPSQMNQDETISTLTYAGRAKKISNTPIVCKEMLSQLKCEQEVAYFGFNQKTRERERQRDRAPSMENSPQSQEVDSLRRKVVDLEEELEADEGIFAEYLKETRILKKRLIECETSRLQMKEDLALAYDSIAALEQGSPRSPVSAWHVHKTDASTCTSLIPTESISPEREELANKLETVISVVELQGLRERDQNFDKVAKDNYYYQKTNKKLKNKLRELTEEKGGNIKQIDSLKAQVKQLKQALESVQKEPKQQQQQQQQQQHGQLDTSGRVVVSCDTATLRPATLEEILNKQRKRLQQKEKEQQDQREHEQQQQQQQQQYLKHLSDDPKPDATPSFSHWSDVSMPNHTPCFSSPVFTPVHD